MSTPILLVKSYIMKSKLEEVLVSPKGLAPVFRYKAVVLTKRGRHNVFSLLSLMFEIMCVNVNVM